MPGSSLQTGTKIDHYNAMQAVHSDLLKRVVWKCVKIEPFFNLHVQRAKLVERRVRNLLFMKIIHEKALSSATLVPTKVVPSLAASSHSFAAKQCLYVTWSCDYACTRNMHNKST
jgi:hypothetical protein